MVFVFNFYSNYYDFFFCRIVFEMQCLRSFFFKLFCTRVSRFNRAGKACRHNAGHITARFVNFYSSFEEINIGSFIN